MEQKAHVCIYRPGKRCTIGLYAGDVSKNTAGDVADLLIVSAFRGNYKPTESSAIGSLTRAGVDFSALRNEGTSINQDCWLSLPLSDLTAKRIGAARVLCYEGGHSSPVESLQMMFSALIDCAIDEDVTLHTIAMPILCAGDQKADPQRMLYEIVSAVTASFEAGLPVEDVRIVTLPSHASEYVATFQQTCDKYSPFLSAIDPPIRHDVFISYCHADADRMIVEKVHSYLETAFGKNIRVFRDKYCLAPGDVIPDKLNLAIRASLCVIAFYSANYVRSGACKMEYSLARLRQSRMPKAFSLRPVLIGAAEEITPEFKEVMWEDASSGVDEACPKAAKIVRDIIAVGRGRHNQRE